MKDLTDITLLIDESSSMWVIKNATIEGINGFILEQQKIDSPAVMTLVTFSEPVHVHDKPVYRRNLKTRISTTDSDPCDYLYRCRPMKEVEKLKEDDYHPIGGSTALYDALGNLIDKTGERFSAMSANRPDKVVIVTMTDGLENASLYLTQEQVRQKIEHQRIKYNWQFLYLGANQDAFSVGASLGVPPAQCQTYDHSYKGTKSALIGTCCAVSDYRTSGVAPSFSKT